MRRSEFDRCLAERDFPTLFIAEMGWNNAKGTRELPPIILDEKGYNFSIVAERESFQALHCEVDEIPQSSLTRRLDAKLRPLVTAGYLAIFSLRSNPIHQLWVVPVKNIEKRDLISVEYDSPEKAEFLYSKIDEFTFDLTEKLTNPEIISRVNHAFSLNSEKITKDFYAGFKREHKSFASLITGISNEEDKNWYASVMLNRLMFCYFIQKKGFLNGDTDYLRHKLEWCRGDRGENLFYRKFYKKFLIRLFSDGLNAPVHDRDFEKTFGRIPYLNGGMFDQHQIEKANPNIDIPDEAFISLFNFFDKWHWHLDTRIEASGHDINPDVLGYIFEQYINDRAKMGAYYTKEDITEYIGRNTILPFIFDKVKNMSKPMERVFAPEGFVWQTLRNSGDRYLFAAVKKGYTADWRKRIPQHIAIGLDTSAPNLLERRKDWNTKTDEKFALPTEIWRETVERLQRCEDIIGKISSGEITSINDFITYNLDVRQFAEDLIAKGEDNFVFNFYEALRSVTILDPTCGSGAFLFAAMNILEPLYYDCIERMQGIPLPSPQVKKALDEITAKYRSNIHYFIFKSIILRNLYGVDLMAEAVEIAKLRLFLKMVAVVDVDYRAQNLGLDPLPDIDFNIRCGNTLVGYANENEIKRDLGTPKTILDEIANQEFSTKIEQEMKVVAATYREFKRLQLVQEEHFTEFKHAKEELLKRLSDLNDTLNRRLFIATKGDPGEARFASEFKAWKASHHPFHWISEFYSIIHDNKGFDVIIGNPPYVEYSRRNVNYEIKDYYTLKSSNLYAFVFERSFNITNSKIGLIVQLSSVGTDGMRTLQEYFLGNSSEIFYGCFPERPKQLFEGACIALSILFCNKKKVESQGLILMGAGVNRTTDTARVCLFQTLSYTHISQDSFLDVYKLFPKYKNPIELSIFEKVLSQKPISEMISYSSNSNSISYRTAGGRYWKIFLNRPFANISTSNKTKSLSPAFPKDAAVALLNSGLFWLYYVNYFDLYNLKDYMIFNMKFTPNKDITMALSHLGKKLMESYEKNKVENTQFVKSKQQICVFESFNPALSKSIIDEIDMVLAQHYGFTQKELDFIINYDIKYRMGDELSDDNLEG
ncbi:MAG: Eco57I restriction-modification methylase domain-containing protein [Bacteroidales bacterium]|nr:Eco57I restriction-modification methylase domain-containing protein [Bacteroidales bacterium]